MNNRDNWVRELRRYREGWEIGHRDGIITGFMFGVASFFILFAILWTIFM